MLQDPKIQITATISQESVLKLLRKSLKNFLKMIELSALTISNNFRFH
jgi:hypothetical protein